MDVALKASRGDWRMWVEEGGGLGEPEVGKMPGLLLQSCGCLG